MSRTKLKQRILDYLTISGREKITVDIATHLNVSNGAVHKELHRLVKEGKVEFYKVYRIPPKLDGPL